MVRSEPAAERRQEGVRRQWLLSPVVPIRLARRGRVRRRGPRLLARSAKENPSVGCQQTPKLLQSLLTQVVNQPGGPLYDQWDTALQQKA
jgi:hypothetical protein